MVATSAETPRQGFAGITGEVAPAAVALAAIVAVFIVAFWPSIAWMTGEWARTASALSHGYLVVAISVLLVVRAVPDVAKLGFEPEWWSLPIVFGLSLVWLLAYVAMVVAVQAIVIPAILFFAIVTVFGRRVGRVLAFPVLYVYFAVPAWEHLQFVFQAITVAIVGFLVRTADIPALLDGNFVHLADGTFEIEGGCSGLGFVVAGLSLAVLYAHLFYDDRRRALVLVGMTLVAAMASNWIRIFAIIYFGESSQMQSPLINDHALFGWSLFGLLLIPLYWFARHLEDRSGAADDTCRPIELARDTRSFIAALLATLAAMLVGPVWAATVSSHSSSDADLSLPPASGEWAGPADSLWNWEPAFGGKDASRTAQYVNGQHEVLVYTNLYRTQRQDKELIQVNNRIEGEWHRRPDMFDNTVVTVGDDVAFRQRIAASYAGEWLIWYRYQVGRRFETSDVDAKLAQAFETLQGRPEAGVIAFATRCTEDCVNAARRLESFVTEIGGAIHVGTTQGDH